MCGCPVSGPDSSLVPARQWTRCPLLSIQSVCSNPQEAGMGGEKKSCTKKQSQKKAWGASGKLPGQYRFTGMSEHGVQRQRERESGKDKHLCTSVVDCSAELKMCFQILIRLTVLGKTEGTGDTRKIFHDYDGKGL